MARQRDPLERDNTSGGLSAVPELGLQLSLTQGAQEPPTEVSAPNPPLSVVGYEIGNIAIPKIVRPAGVRGETGYGDVRGIRMLIPVAKIEQGLLIIDDRHPTLSLGDQSVFELTEAMKLVRTAAVDSLTGTPPYDHFLENILRASPTTDEDDIDNAAALKWSSLDELVNVMEFFPRGDEDLIEPVIEKWPSPIWRNPILREALLDSLNETYNLILIAELGIDVGISRVDAMHAIQKHINGLKDIIATDIIGYKQEHWRGKGKEKFDKYMTNLSGRAWTQWRAEHAPDDPDDGVGRDLLAA